ncbi:hypothetical protein IU448_15080 [Nocardia flavorosea]|nr:hypothetical protein [Nocardia flavorosea]
MEQALLAERAGVDPKTVRSLEKGERWPRDQSRAKIESALQWPAGALDRLLNEAIASIEFNAPLPSAAEVTPTGETASIPDLMVRPIRVTTVPDGRPVAYRHISELVDRARSVYVALEDVAAGDNPEVLVSHAARLHAAAMRVAFEWAGGADGFGNLSAVMPELSKEIGKSPDRALDVLQKIRERNADDS